MGQPRAGDVGTVVDIRENGMAGTLYTVEKVAPDGYTLWIADFLERELERIRNPDDGSGAMT